MAERNHADALERYAFSGVFFPSPYDLRDKPRSIANYVRRMMSRTQQMFDYSGLPDTIPKRSLELMLQTNGHVCIAEVDGELYAFTGSLGGEPDVYYMPTEYIVANPALKLSKSFKIGVDCVVIPSDHMYQGLYDLHSKYAAMLTENDISMDLASVNSRIISLISAANDTAKDSAEEYLKRIWEGKPGIIADSAFMEGLNTQPYGQTGSRSLTDLIEYEQYLKASWYNELGLQSNYNMKRESINSNEAQLNEDMLYPLIDDMLQCRVEGFESVKKMFGIDVSVRRASSWEDNQQEIDNELGEGAAQVEEGGGSDETNIE